MSTSNSVPKNVLEQRIQSFSETTGLSVETTRDALKKLGIDDSTDATTERSLTLLENRDFLSFADLCEVFIDTKLITKPVLRMGIPVLAGTTDSPSTEVSTEEKLISTLSQMAENSKTIDKMTDRELLEKYSERDSRIAKELAERTKGKPCIVFDFGDNVNIEVSLELIKLTKTSPKTISTYPVRGKLHKVYRAGFYPEKPLEESPFYSGEILVNGYCEKSDTDWSNHSTESRILARLQVSIMKNISESDYRDIFETSLNVDTFRKKYRKAAMCYDELNEADALPKLKIRQSQINKVDTAGM